MEIQIAWINPREYLQKLKILCLTWSENLPMQGNLKQKTQVYWYVHNLK